MPGHREGFKRSLSEFTLKEQSWYTHNLVRASVYLITARFLAALFILFSSMPN